MTEAPVPANPSDVEPLDAYALLSKPTLELSDAEVKTIIAHLRAKREAYVTSGGKKADKRPVAKPAAEPITEEKKADNTSLLLAMLEQQKPEGDN